MQTQNNLMKYMPSIRVVLFYGISTIVDYLISNPIYTYIKYVRIVNTKFFKRAWAHFFAHSYIVSSIIM